MTDEAMSDEAAQIQKTFDEMIEQIASSLSEGELKDFESLMETLGDLDQDLGDPPEILGVKGLALSRFLDVATTILVRLIMSKPHGEKLLMHMTLAAGMLIGYQLSENHAKQAESQDGIIPLEEDENDG